MAETECAKFREDNVCTHKLRESYACRYRHTDGNNNGEGIITRLGGAKKRGGQTMKRSPPRRNESAGSAGRRGGRGQGRFQDVARARAGSGSWARTRGRCRGRWRLEQQVQHRAARLREKQGGEQRYRGSGKRKPGHRSN
ncbi:unnamed protein product [Ectocarpus sp. 12 AP-2014]